MPPSASALERALAEGVARLSAVPVPLREVWSPGDCPAELLPWLAWALSVDAWDAAWSEEQKREVVRAAVWVHRHKGTRGAVDRAVGSLGYRVRIREWWEAEPAGQPFTFSIEIEVDDRGVDAALYGSLTRVVAAAKNTRSHFAGFTVASKVRGEVCAGVALQTGAVLRVVPWQAENISETGAVWAGCALQNFSSVTVNP